MIVPELFDWAFFTLYFSIGLLTLCAQVVHFSFAGATPEQRFRSSDVLTGKNGFQ
jgi:hypothetical protein